MRKPWMQGSLASVMSESKVSRPLETNFFSSFTYAKERNAIDT